MASATVNQRFIRLLHRKLLFCSRQLLFNYVLAILRDYKMDFKQYKLNHKDMDRNVKQRTSSGMILFHKYDINTIH